MIKWLSEMFEKMCVICVICVIINFVIGGVIGGVAGGIIGDKIGNDNASTTLLCLIGGLAIAFFINVMNFGFWHKLLKSEKK